MLTNLCSLLHKASTLLKSLIAAAVVVEAGAAVARCAFLDVDYLRTRSAVVKAALWRRRVLPLRLLNDDLANNLTSWRLSV